MGKGIEAPIYSGRDHRILLVSRSLRGFAFGFIPVLLGIYLERRGLTAAGIGVVLAVGLLTGSIYGLPLAALAGRVGRRNVLAGIGVLMALTGIDLALAPQPLLLTLAGATGMLGASSVDLGPFLALEQAILTETVAPRRRNRAFGRYSLAGGLAGALGATVAGLATTLAEMRAAFVGYALVGAATAMFALLLSRRVETSVRRAVLSRTSAGPVLGLSALFTLDALGGGLVILPVIGYWLHLRFGVGVQVLGPILGGITLIQAGSFELAGRLADRLGLVVTMVFTHLPSNVLLILVPLSPNLAIATILLALRFSISQMDVPARQAYVASIVPAAERAGALALTGAFRGIAQSAGTALAGAALQTALSAGPFFAAGGLKIAYDIALYALFRKRPAEHERDGGHQMVV
jgi:MFS family permease